MQKTYSIRDFNTDFLPDPLVKVVKPCDDVAAAFVNLAHKLKVSESTHQAVLKGLSNARQHLIRAKVCSR